MMRHVLIAVGLVLLSACAQGGAAGARDVLEVEASRPPAPPSAAAHDLLGKLVGQWILTGQIAGQPTTHDVEAEWVLQRNYVRIAETSRETDADGKPAYEAIIFVGWLESAQRYVCIWLDNTEVASGGVTCEATAAPDALPFEFRDAQGALIFSNTFTYNSAEDAWEWRMTNVQNGETSTFGLVSLHRR